MLFLLFKPLFVTSINLDDAECHSHHHDHVHDSAVTSVSIVSEGILDLDEVIDYPFHLHICLHAF